MCNTVVPTYKKALTDVPALLFLLNWVVRGNLRIEPLLNCGQMPVKMVLHMFGSSIRLFLNCQIWSNFFTIVLLKISLLMKALVL